MNEDELKPGEVEPDAMELETHLMRIPPDNRDWIILVSMVYVERVLAEESSDDPTPE